jgi:hypothetical protein
MLAHLNEAYLTHIGETTYDAKDKGIRQTGRLPHTY